MTRRGELPYMVPGDEALTVPDLIEYARELGLSPARARYVLGVPVDEVPERAIMQAGVVLREWCQLALMLRELP